MHDTFCNHLLEWTRALNAREVSWNRVLVAAGLVASKDPFAACWIEARCLRSCLVSSASCLPRLSSSLASCLLEFVFFKPPGASPGSPVLGLLGGIWGLAASGASGPLFGRSCAAIVDNTMFFFAFLASGGPPGPLATGSISAVVPKLTLGWLLHGCS